MTKLATIQRIHSIQPHPNNEVTKLEVAKILAWPVVVQKGQYKEGELVVFIVIDSIVPPTPDFAFMEKMKYKVWSAKFKGAPSQGLVMPISILPLNKTYMPAEGDDVTEILGVIKYEKPEPICAEAIGNFPSNLIPRTDEDNLLNNPDVMQEFIGEEVYLTGKADGSSCTVILENGNFRVCSRNLEQKPGTGFWPIVEKLEIEINLRALGYDNLAIQMEVVGPGINGNRMGLTEKSVRVFNVREINSGRWYSWDEIKSICENLHLLTVEFIARWTFKDTTIDELQTIANGYRYGLQLGEGIVLRPINPKFSPTLNRMLSVKILNVDYKQ
jgi:RNA ligase (TIGR02306 family)